MIGEGQISPLVKVPIGLILNTYRSKIIKPTHLRTFLYIKSYYPDRFDVNDNVLKNMCSIINIHQKTLNAHLSILVSNNWIGLDKKNNRLYIRSKYKINNSLTDTKSKVWINLNDLENFNVFCLAAVIAYLAKCYRYKRSNKPEPTNAGSLTGYIRRNRYFAGYAPLAVYYLAKVINRSKSWVDKVKQEGILKGYIFQKKDFIDTNVDYKDRQSYLAINEQLKGRGRFKLRSKTVGGETIHEKQLVIVGIDLLSSKVITGR